MKVSQDAWETEGGEGMISGCVTRSRISDKFKEPLLDGI
jgi:hypothetical protein